MPFLMYINFDNSALLPRDVYYFEYKGVRFKLIQNRSYRWSDVLLTITDDYDSVQAERAYARASELLSAYAWRSGGIATLWPGGGFGIGADSSLRGERCRNWEPHNISLVGHYMGGCDIQEVPHIENDNQRRALLLFRQAQSAENRYLQFLFFWEVLSVGGTKPIGWVDKTFKKRAKLVNLHSDDIAALPMNGKSLGNYFNDDCRHAIAHIGGRQLGKTTVEVDDLRDNRRISLSTRVLREFARAYIKHDLLLNKKMHLVRPVKGGFPVFRSEAEIRSRGFRLAYPLPKGSRHPKRPPRVKWERRI